MAQQAREKIQQSAQDGYTIVYTDGPHGSPRSLWATGAMNQGLPLVRSEFFFFFTKATTL